MSLGIYGAKKLSDVSFSDVDILYSYNSSRELVGDTTLKPLFGSLSSADLKKMLGADGLYKLRLPGSVFNAVGFYSILIKPRTIQTTILDCAYLVTTTNQAQISKKGIVIPISDFQNNLNLVGYQIEYFDSNGNKILNNHKIVTSSDLVSVASNSSNVVQGSTSYVLDQNGTSLFLTLTPDEGSIISSSAQVNLGQQGQIILVSNTFFDPLHIEVEMTEFDIDTLALGIFGNSARDQQTGKLYYFDNNNNVYKIFNLYQAKNQFATGIVDVKQEIPITDNTITFSTIVGTLITPTS